MPIWPPKATRTLEKSLLNFKTLLTESSEDISSLDDGQIVTDAHVNEARKMLVRGEKKKRSVKVAILRAVLELFGGGFFGAAIPLSFDEHPKYIVLAILTAGGLVMFVAAKILEHLTDL